MKEFFAIAIANAATLDANTKLLNEADVNTSVGYFLNRVVELLLSVALPLAVAAVFFAAFTLIKSQGQPDGYKSAKNYLIYTLIGIFFIVFASILVRSFVSFFNRAT